MFPPLTWTLDLDRTMEVQTYIGPWGALLNLVQADVSNLLSLSSLFGSSVMCTTHHNVFGQSFSFYDDGS